MHSRHGHDHANGGEHRHDADEHPYGHGRMDAVGGPGLRRLSPNLYWFGDTCNVYLLKDGAYGLLFDFGSGGILDHLHEAGVEHVEWVLHTHHHRDQCQGDYLLEPRGIRLAVPEREAALFAETDAFWRLKCVYGNYDVSSVGYTLPRSVPVARRLRDYERFEWRGYSIRVVPTPGHTKGSVTFLVEVDGKRIAVAGDMISEHGAVESIHDLQWQYGFPDGVGAALHSVLLIADARPDLVLGSHGHPIADAAGALDALATNLRRLYELQRELRRSRVWNVWPHSVDQPKQKLLPHLWSNPHSCSNLYALLSDDGRGVLLDYGFPSWDHFASDLRFVEHSLAELKAVAGLSKVEAVIPSHYHDDHIAGIPWLQQEHGVEAWIFENFVDILENPAGYNIPCLLPTPIRVDRTLREGQSFTWDGNTFTTFHMPGHTWWALGMFGEVDGTRIAFTGDNLLAGTISPLRAAAPVYRNKMLVDSIAVGAERLREHEPELLLTGHTGAIEVNKQILDDFIGWATLYPYQSQVRAGERPILELRVTNHGSREAFLRASLALPEGWTATPAESEVSIYRGQDAAIAFYVDVPADATGRHVICADVTLGDRRYGWICEAIIDISC